MTGRLASAALAFLAAPGPSGPVTVDPQEPDPPERVVRRINLTFDGTGRHAACLVTDPFSAGLAVESWTFRGHRARSMRLPGNPADGETAASLPVPLGFGRVLVLRQRPGAHELVRLTLADGGVVRRGRTVATSPEFRLLPSAGPAAPLIAASVDADGRTELSRLDPDTGELARPVTVDWPVRHGVWLDRHGRRLGLTRLVSGRGHPVVLDLATGTLDPLPVATDDAHLLLAGAGGVLLLADLAGPPRLLYHGRDGSPRPIPAALAAVEGTVLPLTFDPAGRRVALQVRRGAVRRLVVHDLPTDTVVEAPVPPGQVGEPAAWSADGLRFPYSSAACPSALARLSPSGRGGWTLAGRPSHPRWHDARVEAFAGPAGDVEAVVYGDWHQAPGVVLALHGGPDDAWELDFDPLLQAMAQHGLAVVALNPRGSTGYGPAFRDALRGRWGEVDLGDVLQVGATLRRGRAAAARRPALYGSSYGAFLALLAAGAAPALWSRVAAVAPFRSARRLRDQAGPAVQAMIDRLQGCPPDGAGADVATTATRITAPLLVVHGDQDDVVPVAQSRELVARLRAAGRRDGVDLHYREIPGGGHDPLPCLDGRPGPDVLAMVRFLRTGVLSPFRCQPHREMSDPSAERR